MAILHIFNGDCACDAWKRATGGTAPFLVWRENYLEGPLPADVPREEFERARAEFLHGCVPEYSADALTRFLTGLDARLDALTAQDCVVLWFDVCMFDMLMLSRILYLLKDSKAELRLFCEDLILGQQSDIYLKSPQELRKLAPETIALYASAWKAVLLGRTECFSAPQEPVLHNAIHRYAEDHPADGSLGKSQRRLLALADSGLTDWKDIFRRFNAAEEHPFMGDTMCQRMLASLGFAAPTESAPVVGGFAAPTESAPASAPL